MGLSLVKRGHFIMSISCNGRLPSASPRLRPSHPRCSRCMAQQTSMGSHSSLATSCTQIIFPMRLAPARTWLQLACWRPSLACFGQLWTVLDYRVWLWTWFCPCTGTCARTVAQKKKSKKHKQKQGAVNTTCVPHLQTMI